MKTSHFNENLLTLLLNRILKEEMTGLVMTDFSVKLLLLRYFLENSHWEVLLEKKLKSQKIKEY